MKTVKAATVIATLHLCLASAGAPAADISTATNCADSTRPAIENARQALNDDSHASDRVALACLIEAVASLDDKLHGLSDGSVPFEGQIHVPKGWVMAKPSASEAD